MRTSVETQRKYIKEEWKQLATELPSDPKAVIQDIEFRKFSNWFIAQYLNQKDYVLDCGCGNGYATAYFADYVKKIIGLDYTEGFIKAAAKKYSKLVQSGKLEFVVGDVLKLPYPENTFDKVISERILINLPSWEDQKTALNNYHKVLKKKGRVLLTELTFQGHAAVDKLRTSLGLNIIKKYKRNLYLDEEIFDKFVIRKFNIVEKKHYGTYVLISKILHPLLVHPKEPKFEAKINRLAVDISKKMLGENLPSHTIFYLLEKK